MIKKLLTLKNKVLYNEVADKRQKVSIMLESEDKMNGRRLKAKCTELDVNANDLANALNMSISTYYRKLAKDTFTIKEVTTIANYLHLTSSDVIYVFFNEECRINAMN